MILPCELVVCVFVSKIETNMLQSDISRGFATVTAFGLDYQDISTTKREASNLGISII